MADIPEEYCASLKHFEHHFHDEVFEFLIRKIEAPPPVDLLEFSTDAGVFTSLLTEKLSANRIVSAVRKGSPSPTNKQFETIQVDLRDNDYSKLLKLGQFDVILLKEMLHEVDDLQAFLFEMKNLLKNKDTGRIFVFTRPKNPPVPLPDVALQAWRKMAPTREQIIEAARTVCFREEAYSCSAPIKIEKWEWGNILKGRFFAAVKACEKCSDREINEFIRSRSNMLQFEEKTLILVLWHSDQPLPPPSIENAVEEDTHQNPCFVHKVVADDTGKAVSENAAQQRKMSIIPANLDLDLKNDD